MKEWKRKKKEWEKNRIGMSTTLMSNHDDDIDDCTCQCSMWQYCLLNWLAQWKIIFIIIIISFHFIWLMIPSFFFSIYNWQYNNVCMCMFIMCQTRVMCLYLCVYWIIKLVSLWPQYFFLFSLGCMH